MVDGTVLTLYAVTIVGIKPILVVGQELRKMETIGHMLVLTVGLNVGLL
jgi:hypothetical protein